MFFCNAIKIIPVTNGVPGKTETYQKWNVLYFVLTGFIVLWKVGFSLKFFYGKMLKAAHKLAIFDSSILRGKCTDTLRTFPAEQELVMKVSVSRSRTHRLGSEADVPQLNSDSFYLWVLTTCQTSICIVFSTFFPILEWFSDRLGPHFCSLWTSSILFGRKQVNC